MTLCLFEDDLVGHLAPFVSTRAVYDLRVGARTLLENATSVFEADRLVLHTRADLEGMARLEHPDVAINADLEGGTLFINGRWLVREGDVIEAVRSAARRGQARAFVQGKDLLALWHPSPHAAALEGDALVLESFGDVATERVEGETLIERLWDLIADLGARITHDLTSMGRLGDLEGDLEDGVTVVGREAVHVAAGAVVRAGAVISTHNGPVWIGKGAEVGENAVLRGPVYIGPKGIIKPAARIGTSAFGYRSKVGGEVSGSVIHSLSSKGHDGYLGDSYLGRWCNLGADTNTSNLKNDYGEVSVWDALEGDFVGTGSQFAGLFMGDHSKCSINTMFNTGTVVGVFANVFGAGFPPRHVPDFSWGGGEGFADYRIDKALEVARAVMSRRGRDLSDAERTRLGEIAGS